MISAWHLLWIVPLAACVGAMLVALASAGKEKEEAEE